MTPKPADQTETADEEDRVSLAPLDFEEALAGLLAVKRNKSQADDEGTDGDRS